MDGYDIRTVHELLGHASSANEHGSPDLPTQAAQPVIMNHHAQGEAPRRPPVIHSAKRKVSRDGLRKLILVLPNLATW